VKAINGPIDIDLDLEPLLDVQQAQKNPAQVAGLPIHSA
jgi:hypothetical protein